MSALVPRILKFLASVTLVIGMTAGSAAGAERRTLNRLALPDIPPGTAYSFLVIGHAYGRTSSPHHYAHQYPPASLLLNIGKLKALKPDFVVMLGDFIWRVETPWIEAFRRYVMEPMGVPFVNAVGNHDSLRYDPDDRVIQEIAAYEKRYGPTYFAFDAGGDRHIILDSERDKRSIIGPQKAFFDRTVASLEQSKSVKNVFFWSHYLVWTQADRRYRWLKGEPGNWNFKSDILPAITRLAKSRPVYWGSGNFGSPPSHTLFYDRNKQSGVTFFASGIGDNRRDVVLHIKVSAGGKVSFTPISLIDPALRKDPVYGAFFSERIEDYDVALNKKALDDWLKLDWNFLMLKPRLNSPNLLEKIQIIGTNRFFWHGVWATTLVLVFFVGAIVVVRRARNRTS